jgi:hypothetical protein
VIRHLEESSQAPILYWYFDFRSAETQTCENFVRSLMCQLVYYLPKVPPSLIQLYNRHNSGSRRPSVPDLTTCLLDIIRGLPSVLLLGDAFDECNQWNTLWRFISQVVNSKTPSLHFLFTGRPEQNIEDVVRSLGIPTMDLSSKEMELEVDIDTFVSESLENDFRFSRIAPEGKVLIRESLTSRANGM